MRTFLGLFVLLLLFASAAAWQGRLTTDLRRRQDHQRGVAVASLPSRETLSAGWNTLLVGRPSGAQPFFTPEPQRAAQPRDRKAALDGAPPSNSEWPPEPHFGPDFQIQVRPGDVLGKICQGHYRERPDGLSLHQVVDTVARYNGLASPDQVKVGSTIRLPDVNRFVDPAD